MLRSVMHTKSKVAALLGCLTLTGTAAAALVAPTPSYAGTWVTEFCNISAVQNLRTALSGDDKSYVTPGQKLTYVEHIYNPGPETVQEVIVRTQLSTHLTPKVYPTGTVVVSQKGRFYLTRISNVPIPPGQGSTASLTVTVGKGATNVGAQLQAWALSENVHPANCDLSEPVLQLIHRVPKGAPHTGDGSMAAVVVNRPHVAVRHANVRGATSARRYEAASAALALRAIDGLF
jgi:uncharacterized repeat protein (TIGR01451 family)